MGVTLGDLPADLERLAPLLAAMGPGAPDVGAFTRQVLLDPNVEQRGIPVAWERAAPVGLAVAVARKVPLENAAPDSDRGYLTALAVHPDHRRRGVGTALVDAAEAYLADRGCSAVWASPYAPGYFFPGVDVEAHEPALHLLEGRGYRVASRPLAMRAPLDGLETPEWVAARERAHSPRFRVLPFEPGLARPLLEFARRAFPGDWVRVVRETAGRILEGEAPTRLFVAVREDGEVVGFSHHTRDRFGPIGTDPDVRGQGLGQILMFRTLHAQRAAGYAQAYFLWSDDRTARRLYDTAGFQEWRRFAVMTKSLPL